MPEEIAPKVDVAARLKQWKIEATDPNHPNHFHADLDEPARVYAHITALLHKLRAETESFGREDIVALFGALNSGRRMKNKVADENALPEMRAALLTLIDGKGEPTEKIEVARRAIKYAAQNMLGELYGWAYAETAPLYNGCARDALDYLGYRFDPTNYTAFVAAHEQFKQVYLAQAGRLRPDLPLNLEVDKLYNVIDKVDLKEQPPARTRRFWRITLPDRFEDTLPDGRHEVLDLWEPCLRYNIAAIGFGENQENFQVRKFMSIQPGDGVVAFLRHKMISGIGTVTWGYDADLFQSKPPDQDYWEGLYWFRVGVEWQAGRLDVDQLPLPVRNKFIGQTVVELTQPEFEAVANSIALKPPEPPESETAFSPGAFELLEGIHKEPTKAYYQTHKDEFKAHVEEPFQRIFHDVADRLPTPIKTVMETDADLFGRFPKNDYGRGGAWDFYWGAFYPKEGKRTEDAQLSIWLNYQRLEYGFYIGDYGTAQRERFQHNCGNHAAVLRQLLGNILSNESLLYGSREDFTFGPDGSAMSMSKTDWQEFLSNPAQFNNDISVVVSRVEILRTPLETLVNRIAGTYKLLFPLVLLAVREQPMPEIAAYLEAIGVGDENIEPRVVQPEYTLAQCTEDTGFAADELAGWVRAIERKGQAILYGPPGTGKTYVAEKLARHLIGGEDGFLELVQFHPAYAYEDFVQGIRPKTADGGGLSYPTVPGRFLEFCKKAKECRGRCVLIIDEINRANLARVFGELMYLLEYRDREVPLAGGGTLRIPDNVRVIGTMNTADRSIALVDHALRRRFAFLALYPNCDVLRDFHRRKGTGYPVEKLIHLLTRLNGTIDRHYAVGITFFLRDKLADEIADIWRMEIEPYLDEYFFDQPDKADAFRWERVQTDLLP